MLQLCDCITVKQLDDYGSWLELVMVLKNIGSFSDLWEELRKHRKTHKRKYCSTRWTRFKANTYTFATLKYLPKEGDVQTYNSFKRLAHSLTGMFDAGHAYPVIDIDTLFLTMKKAATDEMNAGQKAFQERVSEVL